MTTLGDMLIPRKLLQRTLMAHRDTEPVKVLTGVRRCGKSTLLRMHADAVIAQGVPERNVFLKRFDGFDVPMGYSAADLYDELRQAAQSADDEYPLYVLLDEIQDVPNWERVVRRLHTRSRTDVYITGSNSKLLSGDLATYLAGRYVSIPVFPLSFAEYVAYRNELLDDSASHDVMLGDYMRYGGMPGLFKHGMPDESDVREQLQAVYDSVVVKDVAERNNIRDLGTLRRLSRYLFATAGTLFSVRNVSNALKNAGTPVDPKTVDAQIRALEQAFIVYSAEQEGLAGKKLLRPQAKYYPVDNGFRNLANDFRAGDFGAQLEGVVFMELMRRGYDVHVGDAGGAEVDFVARRGPQRIYIQVTLSLLEESTRERELRPLLKLSDAFPRMVIVLDGWGTGITDDGINIVRADSWLLNDQATV